MQSIIGIDEVGRGSIMGPLCVAAVFLCADIAGLADSKQLSVARRRALLPIIKAQSTVGLGWVSAIELNKIGLGVGLRLAAQRAMQQLPEAVASQKRIVIDGSIDLLDGIAAYKSEAIVKADTSIKAVMAASIVAKESRDAVMRRMSALYPLYGLDRHVGYGTANHIAAIMQYGITAEHRTCFPKVQALARKSAHGRP